MIRIVSKKNSFRRCGISHPDKAVDYPNDTFTPVQLKALKAEPMLVVQELPDKPAPDSDDLGQLTVEQLKERCASFQPMDTLKGLKKADLIALLKANPSAGSQE